MTKICECISCEAATERAAKFICDEMKADSCPTAVYAIAEAISVFAAYGIFEFARAQMGPKRGTLAATMVAASIEDSVSKQVVKYITSAPEGIKQFNNHSVIIYQALGEMIGRAIAEREGTDVDPNFDFRSILKRD